MKEPIPFPNNFEGHLQLGKNEYELGHLEGAKEQYEAAYNLEQKFEANYLLTKVLVEMDEYVQAKEIANEMKINYLNENHIDIYFQILLGNHDFIQSRRVLFLLSKHLSEKKKEQLTQKVALSEQYFDGFKQEIKNNLVKEAEKMIEMISLQQITVVKKLEQLPMCHYEELAKRLLKQKKIHPIVRASILETLTQMNSEENFNYMDINGQLQTVIPSHLPLIQEQKIALRLKEELVERTCHYDDYMKKVFQQELNMQMAVLYPFASDTIQDVHGWIDVLINYIENSHQEKKKHTDNITRELQQKVKKIILQIT